MSLSAKIRRAPLRVATGAFIFNSGVDHLRADEETVGQLHAMAAGTYPFLGKVDPRLFARALAAGELAVGALLLVPIVPLWLAGLSLTGFAGGLVGLYARTPGLRRERSVFPTQQGLGFAKDTWLAAIGISLLADAVFAGSPTTSNSQSVPHRD
jgi:DoxX